MERKCSLTQKLNCGEFKEEIEELESLLINIILMTVSSLFRFFFSADSSASALIIQDFNLSPGFIALEIDMCSYVQRNCWLPEEKIT